MWSRSPAGSAEDNAVVSGPRQSDRGGCWAGCVLTRRWGPWWQWGQRGTFWSGGCVIASDQRPTPQLGAEMTTSCWDSLEVSWHPWASGQAGGRSGRRRWPRCWFDLHISSDGQQISLYCCTLFVAVWPCQGNVGQPCLACRWWPGWQIGSTTGHQPFCQFPQNNVVLVRRGKWTWKE